jgi:hypothetical protein
MHLYYLLQSCYEERDAVKHIERPNREDSVELVVNTSNLYTNSQKMIDKIKNYNLPLGIHAIESTRHNLHSTPETQNISFQ